MRDYLNKSFGPAYETVTERIGDLRAAGVATRTGDANVVEARGYRVESRVNADGSLHVTGYALTWDTWYDVAGGPDMGGWQETISRGALDKALAEKDDVRFLINHEGTPLARTASGTMILTVDDIGLRVDVPSLDPSNPRAQELRSALERGDVDQMSWAFRVIRQNWSKDYSERRITEVRIFDVSAVTFPANTATIVGLRNEQPAETPEQPVTVAKRSADMPRYSPRQVAQYEADEQLVEVFGPYNQGDGPDGAHYVPVSPFSYQCSQCAFYEGGRACEIVEGDIAPEGICKRWIIPADLIQQTAQRSGLPLSLAIAQAAAIG